MIFIISCSQEQKDLQNTQKTTQKKNLTIDDIIVLPNDFQVKYKIEKEEDLNYKNITRKQIRITVPSDLSKDELQNNIKHVVKYLYNKSNPDGISVLVYESGDNVMSAYTVAMGEFAPYGNWSLISANHTIDNYKIEVDIKDSYFNPRPKLLSTGSNVFLYKDQKYDRNRKEFVPASEVGLSKSINSWVEEDIIIFVPNNISAKILDVYKENLAGVEYFIRYKVAVSIQGNYYEGWVHDYEVKS